MLIELGMMLSLACPGEYEGKLNLGRAELFAGNYAEAARLALEARSVCPEDPESFELRSTALILQTKELSKKYAARKNEKVARRIERCPECRPLIGLLAAEVRQGSEAAERAASGLMEERNMFLLARLQLNQVWMHLELQEENLAARAPFGRAHRLLADLLARNPRHVRALVAMAGVDYVLDAKVPWYAKPFLPDGNKDRAFRYLATALALAGPPAEAWEAKFVLWGILSEERGRETEARTLAEELRALFPANPSFRNAS